MYSEFDKSKTGSPSAVDSVMKFLVSMSKSMIRPEFSTSGKFLQS